MVQPKVLCLIWKVGYDSIIVIVSSFWGRGGGMDVFLLLRFLLFRTKYVRYLMTFWCFFMRLLIFYFEMFIVASFFNGMLVCIFTISRAH